METINLLLLVEDDENDIIITKRKLNRANLPINELLVTKTLAETKSLLNTHKVDIILLDLNLPDSRGLDTVDSVRAFYNGIIIVLTSIDDELSGINAIRRGADEYLVKSHITDETLKKAIYFSLERQRRWARVSHVEQTIKKLEKAVVGAI